MIDKTESAVETLRDAMTTRGGCDYFAMGAARYRDMLYRVIDAPVDADGNLLDMGDEVTSWGFDGAKRVTSFRLFEGLTWDACVVGGASWPCSDLHRVMPDSRERIEADAERWSPEAYDLVRRCFALVDGEGR